jgi:hypothetical protein
LKEYLNNNKALFIAVAAHHETTSYTPLKEWAKRRGLES